MLGLLDLTADLGDSAESAASAHQQAAFLPRLNFVVKQKSPLAEPVLKKNSSQAKLGKYNKISDIMNEAQASDDRESPKPIFSRNMKGNPHRSDSRI